MSSEYEIMTGTQPHAEDLGVEVKRTDTQTLIDAMRILARDVQCDDGIANAAIAEAADRLKELRTALIEVQGMVSEAIIKPSKRTKWLREIETRLMEALQ